MSKYLEGAIKEIQGSPESKKLKKRVVGNSVARERSRILKSVAIMQNNVSADNMMVGTK